MWRRNTALALLLFCGTASASLENDGVWRGGLWASTVWADGVWREGEGSTVSVPDVIGMDEAAADAALEAVLLDTGNVSLTCSAETEGNVISQSPPAGASVPEGSLVDLTTSTGVACEGAGGKFKLRLDLRL